MKRLIWLSLTLAFANTAFAQQVYSCDPPTVDHRRCRYFLQPVTGTYEQAVQVGVRSRVEASIYALQGEGLERYREATAPDKWRSLPGWIENDANTATRVVNELIAVEYEKYVQDAHAFWVERLHGYCGVMGCKVIENCN